MRIQQKKNFLTFSSISLSLDENSSSSVTKVGYRIRPFSQLVLFANVSTGFLDKKTKYFFGPIWGFLFHNIWVIEHIFFDVDFPKIQHLTFKRPRILYLSALLFPFFEIRHPKDQLRHYPSLFSIWHPKDQEYCTCLLIFLTKGSPVIKKTFNESWLSLIIDDRLSLRQSLIIDDRLSLCHLDECRLGLLFPTESYKFSKLTLIEWYFEKSQ